MAERMEFQQLAFGMTQFANDDIALAGGARTGRKSTAGTVMLRYTAYDARQILAGIPAAQAEVGFVEINVRPDDGTIEGLVKLEVAKGLRGQGIGRRIVEAIAATSPEGLKVYDIKASAIGFWQSVGCEVADKRPGRQRDGAMRVSAPAEDLEAAAAPRM